MKAVVHKYSTRFYENCWKTLCNPANGQTSKYTPVIFITYVNE